MKSRLLSGKVKKLTGTRLDGSRYEYLDVSQAEPDLGLPAVDGSVLISLTTGTRIWSNALVINTLTSAVAIGGELNVGGIIRANTLSITTTSYIANAQILTTATVNDFITVIPNQIYENTSSVRVIDNFDSGVEPQILITVANNDTVVYYSTLTEFLERPIVIQGRGLSDFAGIPNNALQVYGGIGAQQLYISGTAYLGGAEILTTQTGVSSELGSLIASLATTLTTTTNSTSTSSGALVVKGGIGVGKDVYIGGTLVFPDNGRIITNQIEVKSTGSNTSSNTGVLLINGGIVTITTTTVSTSSTTGALTVVGGVGIGGDLYVGGIASLPTVTGVVNFTSTASSTSSTSGALRVAGGVGISGDLFVGGNITANQLTIEYTTITTTVIQTDDIIVTLNTSSAISTDTGALRIAGGAGIGGDLWVGGKIYSETAEVLTTATVNQYANQTSIIAGTDTAVSTSTGNITIWNTSTLESVTGRGNSTTNAISILNETAAGSTDTGALTVVGGAGIGGDLYVGGKLYQAGLEVITTASVNDFANQTSITAGTDTAVSTSTGNITIWNTSTLQSVTNRGNSTTNAIRILNTSNSITTGTGALVVEGGLYVAKDTRVDGDLYLKGSIVLTSATLNAYVASTDIRAGTDTAVSSEISTGTNIFYVWNTSTLQTITNRGNSTTNAISILNTSNSALNVAGGVAFGSTLNIASTLTFKEGSTIDETPAGATTVTLDQLDDITNWAGTLVFTRQDATTYQALPDGPSISFDTSTWILGYDSTLWFSSTDLVTWVAGPYAGTTPPTGTLSTGSTNLTVNGNTWTFGTDGTLTAPGDIYVQSTSSSTSTDTGALTVVGGVGIGENLYVKGIISAEGGFQGLDAKRIFETTSSVTVSDTGTVGKVTVTIANNTNTVFSGNKVKFFTPIEFANSGTIADTTSSLVLTPPGALAGQGLVIRPTVGGGLFTSDTFAPGGSVAVTFIDGGSHFSSGGTTDTESNTWTYTISGISQADLGSPLTGSFLAENWGAVNISHNIITFNIPALSQGTGFVITLDKIITEPPYYLSGVILDGNGRNSLAVGSVLSNPEVSHLHLISADPTTVDLYLGDDDQYVKIVKNAGGVVIGTNTSTYHWIFDNNGNLTAPGGLTASGINLLNKNQHIWYVDSVIGVNDYTKNSHPMAPARTIKYILGYANDGDTVFIQPGTYYEEFPLTVAKGVSVRGAGLREVFVYPTTATNTSTAFLVNGETLISDFTVGGFFEPGYAFEFAPNAHTFNKSPYIERLSVITKGSTTSAGDPNGFDATDAGGGAKIDGSRVLTTSTQASMMFNEATFIVPNATGLYMTNGARAEVINTFFYFADKAIHAVTSSTGYAGAGKTKLKLGGISGTLSVGDTLFYKTSGGDTLASGTIASVDGSYVYITGAAWGFDTVTTRTAKIISVLGNTNIDTVVKKYGTGSAKFDGTGDALAIPTSADFAFGTGTFTIECWVRLNTLTGTQILFDFRNDGTPPSSYAPILTLISGTLNYQTVAGNRIVGTTLTTSTWYHVALSRSGSSTKLFLDGTQVGSTYTDTNNYIQGPLTIGSQYNSSFSVNGYIDDIRVTKGLARYTTSFVAPTSALVVDAYTVLMLHANGVLGSTVFTDENAVPQVIYSTGTNYATATSIDLADYHQFGAEIRSLGSAAIFGNTGVTADGTGTDIKLIAFNVSHIGAGKDSSDDISLVVQANEIIQINGGKVYFQTVDQGGDFRVGESFLVNQRTGDVSFGNAQVNLGNLGQLTVTDGSNNAVILPTSVSVGSLVLSGGSLVTQAGDLTLDPAGTLTTINSDLQVDGAIIVASGINSTSTDTGALTVVGGVGIGGELYVGGKIYSETAEVLTTATVNDFANQTSITAGTDTAVSALSGSITVWNTSTLESVTGRGNSTTKGITIIGDFGFNGTTSTFNSTLLFDNSYNDIARGPNKIKLYDDGAWISGIGVSYKSVDIYSGKDTNFYQGAGPDTNNVGYLTLSISSSSVVINATSATVSTTTGALVVSGGVGIGGDLWVGGKLYANNLEVVTTATVDQALNQTLQTITDKGFTTTNQINVLNTSNAISITTAAFVVSGGASIGLDLRVGGSLYVNNLEVVTTGTVDQALNQTLQTITEKGFTTTTRINVLNTVSSTATVTENALYVAGGVGIGQSLYVTGKTFFQDDVTFAGNSTFIFSTNTFYTDNLIELHVPGSVYNDWTVNDGKDIGLRFHYYRTFGGDTNAALILSPTTGYLTWYGTGAETDTGVFSTATYGSFKTGEIEIANSTTSFSTNTGALRVVGGVGIGGDLYVGGNIYGVSTGSTFSGTANAATNIVGGAEYQIPFQSTTSTTNFDNKLRWISASSTLAIGTPNDPLGSLTVENNVTVGDVLNVSRIRAIDTSSIYFLASGIYNTATSTSSHFWSFGSDGRTNFPNYSFPAEDGPYGFALVTNGTGTVTWSPVLSYVGSIGYTGSSSGFTGSTGYWGSIGEIGYTGSIGYSGSEGVGFTGSSSGYIGSFGYTGSVGYTGSQGAGYTGSKGFIGSEGYTGSAGAGFSGSQGIVGYIGSTGLTGFIGSRGVDGTSVRILGSVANTTDLPGWQYTYTGGAIGDGYIVTSSGHLWVWSGTMWVDAGLISGPQGERGFIGSQGAGFTGSSAPGYVGSVGYQGSKGALDPWTKIVANYSASNNQRLIADTSAGQFTVALPDSPTIGSYLIITDGYSWSTIPLLVTASIGTTIEGYGETLQLDITGITVEFIWSGATWQVTATLGVRGSGGYTGSMGAFAALGFTGSQAGLTTVQSDILPATSSTYALGAVGKGWTSVYANFGYIGSNLYVGNETVDSLTVSKTLIVSTSTMYLGGNTININSQGTLLLNNAQVGVSVAQATVLAAAMSVVLGM